MTVLPPIRRQVVVPAAPDVAFDVFTRRIGDWWPLSRFSVYGEKGTVAFRDGRLIETGVDGDEAVWGTVVTWRPPEYLRLTWHPGHAAPDAGQVSVTFAPVTPALTMVTVEHSDWEKHPDPGAARDEYRNGWPAVLAAYATRLPGDAAGDGPVYLVLSHTPAPGVTDPFRHPGFAGHREFLNGLRERGVLVAAGPFPPTGEGMTVLRIDDPADVPEIVRAAGEQDASVTGGVLEVRVRPWVPMMIGDARLPFGIGTP